MKASVVRVCSAIIFAVPYWPRSVKCNHSLRYSPPNITRTDNCKPQAVIGGERKKKVTEILKLFSASDRKRKSEESDRVSRWPAIARHNYRSIDSSRSLGIPRKYAATFGMEVTVGMLPVVESPHKKAKMEGRRRADFSESKFVKFYKAGASQAGATNEEDDAVNCSSAGCHSPPCEAQMTVALSNSLDRLDYGSPRPSPTHYPVDMQCAARYGTNLSGENKENLQTENNGKVNVCFLVYISLCWPRVSFTLHKYLNCSLCVHRSVGTWKRDISWFRGVRRVSSWQSNRRFEELWSFDSSTLTDCVCCCPLSFDSRRKKKSVFIM